MDTSKLIDTINDLPKTRYMKKPIANSIKSDLETIKNKINDTDKPQLNKMIELVSNNIITKKIKNEIIQIRAPIINIIKKYEEEYNDQPNEDNINTNLSPEEVEKLLDDKIPGYYGFNENNPMEGISYDKTNNIYKVQFSNFKINNKSLSTACEIAKEKIQDKNIEISNNFIYKSFPYKGHQFICYWHNGEPYFDIQHIIQVLNLKTTSWNAKYNEFSGNVSCYKWHQNEFGGYVLRELINDKTMYKIILSSNSVISVSFKNDVAEILANLRKKCLLEVTNEKISIKPKTKNMNQEFADILHDQKKLHMFSYDSLMDVSQIKQMIYNGKIFPISKYANTHVLYAFIIPLKTDHRYFVIKFGHTENIIKRFTSLKIEPYFICIIHFILFSTFTLISLSITNGYHSSFAYYCQCRSLWYCCYYDSCHNNNSIDFCFYTFWKKITFLNRSKTIL
jgi:prophage antirepressor-like protein